MTLAGETSECLTVFHDGSCPLCRREIALARKMAEGVDFVDVSRAGTSDVAPGLPGNVAMQRFHVRRADGATLSGAAAFIEMWSHVPRLRWISPIGRRRWLVWLLDRIYGLFLHLRPAISGLLRRWDG
jgi:predicted DCC family thiol-disulfide oxidoreductase YuxK